MIGQSSIREVKLRFDNEFILNLVSFLIQEEDYSFVGNQSELWLENLSHPKAQLIYINHQKQLTPNHGIYISEKAKVITHQIKRTYLMSHVHVLILDVAESCDVTGIRLTKGIGMVKVKDAKHAKDSIELANYFPRIKVANLTMGMTDVMTSVQYQTLEKTLRKAQWLNTKENIMAIKGYLFVLIVVAAYLLIRSTPQRAALTATYYGAAYPPLVIAGQYWRLLTNSFLHLDPIHLLFNAVFIFRFGGYIEGTFGKLRTMFILLMSGLMSSLFGLAFIHPFLTGATGVVYGFLGAMVFLGFEDRKTFMPMVRKLVFPILFVTLAITFLFPQMGTITHIGGVVGGFLAASMVGILKVKPFYLRSMLTAMTFFILVGGMWLGGLRQLEAIDWETFNRELIDYYQERGQLERSQELRQLFEIEVE